MAVATPAQMSISERITAILTRKRNQWPVREFAIRFDNRIVKGVRLRVTLEAMHGSRAARFRSVEVRISTDVRQSESRFFRLGAGTDLWKNNAGRMTAVVPNGLSTTYLKHA